MTISFLKFFILGIGSAVIALFAQVLIANPQDTTLITLLLLTCIEETVRFLILFFAERKNIFPLSFAFTSVFFFGMGFAISEITFSQEMTPIHIGLLLLVHILLSLIIFLGIRPRKPLLTAVTYGVALAVHMGYNALVWFARF
jgi:hypothetical protein